MHRDLHFDLQVFPSELVEMTQLQSLRMRSNPIRDIPSGRNSTTYNYIMYMYSENNNSNPYRESTSVLTDTVIISLVPRLSPLHIFHMRVFYYYLTFDLTLAQKNYLGLDNRSTRRIIIICMARAVF